VGICWYCHWGWSKPVAEIYQKHAAVAGESAMHYGAAHIVWDDENFEREHVQWCLDNFEKYKRDDASDAENDAVRQSLIDLLALPDAVLAPCPDDYDDEHPDKYPPAMETVHV